MGVSSGESDISIACIASWTTTTRFISPRPWFLIGMEYFPIDQKIRQCMHTILTLAGRPITKPNSPSFLLSI